jgi:predicted AlkP superfamily pyrophosphatase or phosphodiesterase
MMSRLEHLMVLNVVGLSPRHFERPQLIPHLSALAQRGLLRPLAPSFPAVTCSVQATLLSGQPPSAHGIVANGYFDRERFEVTFWDQPAARVRSPRLWDLLKAKRPELTTAVLFWQNSMFINSDFVVSPRPLHLDSGLVQWCYSKPTGYYEELAAELGAFKLQHYWGPLAGLESSRWIARAAAYTWRKHRPNLMLVYLPHLDYASQKFGPEAAQTDRALRQIDGVVGELLAALGEGPEVVACSEYSLRPVRGAIFPNRLLREAGLLRVRQIAGKEYLDLELSEAFAMADHQVAHIYCSEQAIGAARAALQAVPGLEWAGLAHPRAGELIAVAPPDRWFAYYWWTDWNKAPEFAFTVDIHRKPGYDPCELWFDWRKFLRTWRLPTTATDPGLVRGSHGRLPSGDENWATLVLDERVASAAAQHGVSLAGPVEATELAPLVCRLLL